MVEEKQYNLSETELLEFLIKYKDSDYEEWNYVTKFIRTKRKPKKSVSPLNRQEVEAAIMSGLEDSAEKSTEFIDTLDKNLPDEEYFKELDEYTTKYILPKVLSLIPPPIKEDKIREILDRELSKELTPEGDDVNIVYGNAVKELSQLMNGGNND